MLLKPKLEKQWICALEMFFHILFKQHHLWPTSNMPPSLIKKYICQARHIFVLKPNLVWMYVYVEYQHLICNPESIQDQRKRKNGRKPILSWTLAYTPNFLILISLQPDVADFLNFKRYIWAKELSSRLKLWFSYPFKKCAWCYSESLK